MREVRPVCKLEFFSQVLFATPELIDGPAGMVTSDKHLVNTPSSALPEGMGGGSASLPGSSTPAAPPFFVALNPSPLSPAEKTLSSRGSPYLSPDQI